jgi:ankyrin repeat protein
MKICWLVLSGLLVWVVAGNAMAGSELKTAIEKGDVKLVSELVKDGADVNEKDSFNDTPLNIAVHNGQFEIVRILVDNWADLNTTNNAGNHSLNTALNRDQIEIAKFLIEKGVEVNAVRRIETAPLLIAAEKGQVGIVKLLIEKGVNINKISNLMAGSPLFVAVHYGQIEVIKLLIQNHVKLESTEYFGYHIPLHEALKLKRYDIAKILIKAGANLCIEGSDGNDALWYFQRADRSFQDWLKANVVPKTCTIEQYRKQIRQKLRTNEDITGVEPKTNVDGTRREVINKKVEPSTSHEKPSSPATISQ